MGVPNSPHRVFGRSPQTLMPVPNRQPTYSETVNETETNKLKTVIVSEENIAYTIRKADKSESNKLTNQTFTENLAVFSLL